MIIPIGGKAATVLIERTANALSGTARPWQIKRVARAEAEAEIIKSKGEAAANLIRSQNNAESQEVIHRSIARLEWEGLHQQINMERIIQKSLLEVNEEATPEKIEQDWLTFFFNQCRLTSNDEMQNFWARILAGEANTPGAFSRRTIQVVSTLSKEDAELFQSFGTYCWIVDGRVKSLFYNELFQRGFHTIQEMIRRLQAAGLVICQTAPLGSLHSMPTLMKYYDGEFQVTPGAGSLRFTSDVHLTEAGEQLFLISGSTPNAAYFRCCMDRFKGLISPQQADEYAKRLELMQIK